jgi:exosortase
MIWLVIAMVLAACAPTVLLLHREWTDWEGTYSHGYLVAVISIFLLWRSRPAAGTAPREALDVRALAALLVAGLAWLVGARSGLAGLELLLLPVLLVLAVWVALGAAAAKRALFAVGFLYVASPLWGSINAIPQWTTIFVVRGLLRAVGIPSYFEGNLVHLPAGTFEIAGGCSGLHYLMVAIALGLLMGELRGDRWPGRLRLLLLAVALAIFANWVRVFTIILAGHYTDMQHYLVAQSHYGYGWALFALAIAAFCLLERRMPVAAVAPPTPAPVAPMARSARLLPLASAGLALGVIALLQSLSARPAAAGPAFEPAPGGQWTRAPAQQGAWLPRVAGADASSGGDYMSAQGVLVQRRHFVLLSQRQGKELGGYGDDLTGTGIDTGTREDGERATLGSRPATLYRVRGPDGVTSLVAASYSTAGRTYAGPVAAQLRYAVGSLARLRSQPASLTLWRTPCVPDCAAARQQLERFVTVMEAEN